MGLGRGSPKAVPNRRSNRPSNRPSDRPSDPGGIHRKGTNDTMGKTECKPHLFLKEEAAVSTTTSEPKVLIYYEREERARELEALVRERFPQMSVTVATTPKEAEAGITDAEILIGWGTPPGLLESAPRLRWFHKLGAGVDDLMMTDQIPEGVTLTRTDGSVFAERMAEYAIAYMLAFTQNVPRILQQQRERSWTP